MKRILQVTTVSLSLGFISDHVNKLVEDCNQVDIATNIVSQISPKLIDESVNIFQIEFQRNPISIKNILAYKNIKALCKENKYDIVHVHTPVASFLTRLALRKEKGVKVVYTTHGFHFYKGANIINWILFYPMERLAAKWTDAIITINNEDFLNAKKFKLRDKGKVHKINGVGISLDGYKLQNFDKSLYRKKLHFKDDDFIILVLAELNKNKNHIQLVKAMNLLKYKYPNIKAIFAGTGPLEKDIKKKIKENKLEDNIKLIGWRNDVKELINVSDIVSLMSKREGLGKCLLEAMICNTCILATDTRGPRELIKSGENGFLVRVDDFKETARKIEEIYMNIDLKKNFEKKSYLKVKEYSLENVLSMLDVIYDQLNI